MCWNPEVSLGSFGIVSVITYLLWSRNSPNDRMMAFFLFSYGLMQLFETLMWWGQDPESQSLNRVGSFAAAILLFFHPLAILLGMRFDTGYKGVASGSTYQLAFGSAILFFLYGIWTTVDQYVTKKRSFLSYPDSVSGHLVWEFPDAYVNGLVLMLLTGIALIAPKYPTLFASLLLYFLAPVAFMSSTMKVSKLSESKNYIGSYWCWWVASFSFLLYGLNRWRPT